MPQRACLRCGRISAAKICEACQPNERPKNASWSKWRNRSEQARFRKLAIELFGGQCAAVIDGVRCHRRVETHDLQAHHGEHGPVLLCRSHHRAVDPHAR